MRLTGIFIILTFIVFQLQSQVSTRCPYAPEEPLIIVTKSQLNDEKAVELRLDYDLNCNATITRSYHKPNQPVSYGYYSYVPGGRWYISNEFKVGYEDTGRGSYYVVPFESNHYVTLGNDSLEIGCDCEEEGEKDLLWTLKANNVLYGVCRINKKIAHCNQITGIGSGALKVEGSVFIVKANSLNLVSFNFSEIQTDENTDP